jgi:hypothetical protein
LHQVRREVVARLAPAQLKQVLEVIRHTKVESILLLDFDGTEGARSSRRPPVREPAWKISRSPSGIPSMSQITVCWLINTIISALEINNTGRLCPGLSVKLAISTGDPYICNK